MAKIKVHPTTMVYPVPAAMISCRSSTDEDNIITIAWIGTICSEPPMLSISIRPQRHSYDIIKDTMEFIVNLSNEDVLFATDYCGVRSGRHVNKFKELNLTKIQGDIVNAPMIKECPINLECKVKKIEKLGTHDMFIAEIVAVHIDEEYVNDNEINLNKANLISYIKGNYCKTGEVLDIHSFAIKKK